jgi:tRNA (guanine37-N1)-methyltransferase
MSGDLKSALAGQLSPAELDRLVRSYDVVGDIAVIIVPDDLLARKRLIADAILAQHRNIRVVARRAGHYGGEFRVLPLEIIGGEDRRETLHKENGVRLLVNLEQVYYSVRSGNERKRVASLVREGETVLVLFSGIGPYPLVIGHAQPGCRVVGIEKNPEAHAYALANLSFNRKIRNVSFLAGDVRDVVPRLGTTFNRIVMPLPKSAGEYLELALGVLHRGGWLHFYELREKGEFAAAVDSVERACRSRGRLLAEAAVTVAGHCSPRLFRICVDARVD